MPIQIILKHDYLNHIKKNPKPLSVEEELVGKKFASKTFYITFFIICRKVQ